MNLATIMQLQFELFKEWLKETFGGGVKFPTAPGYVQGYSK